MVPAPRETPTIAVAARPRTLVLVVAAEVIDAVMLGPTGMVIGHPTQVPSGPEPRGCFERMWPELEPFGEFDRITVMTRAGLGADWSPSMIARELERQSLRPVRLTTVAELRWSHVIRSSGVELVIALGADVESSLFLDGVPVPGLALGRHRFRKGRTYQQYLAPRVLERKGPRAWNKRLARAVDDILAVWNPSMLYLALPSDLTIELELGPTVVIVPAPTEFEGALALWAT